MDIEVNVGAEAEVLQVQAIKALAGELPLNDFGLPTGIYRVDLLPFHNYKPTHTNGHALPRPSEVGSPEPSESPSSLSPEDEARGDPSLPVEYRVAGFLAASLPNAFVPLQYDEGFPAFENGQAFWYQLDSEPSDIFRAFETYLQMACGRAGVSGDPEDPEDEGDPGKAAAGTRSISSLVAMLHPAANDIELLSIIEHYKRAYHVYYWGLRARAYDLFRVAQHRRRQEIRAIETQDEHYIDAKRIRHKIMQYINGDEEFWELMTPKVAIDLLKQTTSLERISAGLPAAGPAAAGSEDRSGESLELTFRTIAQSNRASSEGTVVDEEGELLDRALEDPVAVEILQRLIIRKR
ncbi:hypothetical protein LCGC14_0947900 [marine sediment metagenome]|uniref:Uncharacterized protein n=1 Tax=marine sediment metagenome TaxID=412755 RepID=A0A0F9R1N9_9ZZZZ